LFGSTGVTCDEHCLRKAKNTRSRVPGLWSGVCRFLKEIEKKKKPPKKGF
jgi:hypothetical protein